jgi:hypothetical protein
MLALLHFRDDAGAEPDSPQPAIVDPCEPAAIELAVMFSRYQQFETAQVLYVEVMACAPGDRQDCKAERRERCTHSVVGEPGRERKMVKLWPVEPVGELGQRIPSARGRNFEIRRAEVKQRRLGDDSAENPVPEILVTQLRVEGIGLPPDHIHGQRNPAENHGSYDLEPQVSTHAGAGLVRLPAGSFGSNKRHDDSPFLFGRWRRGIGLRCDLSLGFGHPLG